MQRVQREQGRHHRAAPGRTRHALQEQEQHNRVGQVEEQADEVMPAGIQPEELDIQHVGNPRQRMPVARKAGLEGPGNVLPVEPVPDVKV